MSDPVRDRLLSAIAVAVKQLACAATSNPARCPEIVELIGAHEAFKRERAFETVIGMEP
jgi:hypothetical protein